MTDQSFPITPPRELRDQWRKEAPLYNGGYVPLYNGGYVQREDWFMGRAAQWGADQELLACGLLLDDGEHAASYGFHNGDSLHAARRPKPPSLKEQALEQLCEVNAMLQFHTTGGETSAIRRALEALPND